MLAFNYLIVAGSGLLFFRTLKHHLPINESFVAALMLFADFLPLTHRVSEQTDNVLYKHGVESSYLAWIIR